MGDGPGGPGASAGRVARFDVADESTPAAQAGFAAIGADDEPAAVVADFAGGGPAPEYAAPVANLGESAAGSGGMDVPDDADRSDAMGGSDLVDGPPLEAVRTARFGDTARGGRRAARSRPTTPTQPADDEPAEDDGRGRSGAGRSGARSSGSGSSGSGSMGSGSTGSGSMGSGSMGSGSTGSGSTGFGSSGSGASRSGSGFAASGFGGRSPRGRAATRRAEADGRAEVAHDGPATEPAAPPAARRGFGPTQVDPDADPVAAAREICLRLLTDRSRTRHELARALAARGVPADAADTVLSRFDEVGLVDDAAFAGQWVRSRHTHRGLARRAIAMELRRKGVDDEVAGEALEEVDDDSEARRARELVDRKLRTVPADTPEQRRKAANRLVGMLARKGYGGGVAYRVVREALADHGAELDERGTDPPD